MTTTATIITGNTYPVKDALKAAGCKWDANRKCWVAANEEIAAKAAVIMAEAPMPTRRVFACRSSFAGRRAWSHRSNGGVGFCGAPGCGRNGCRDCRD